MWISGENVVERRYELQLERMLAQAEVPPELTEGLLTRLDEFVLPFTAALVEPEQRWHTVEYMTGLLSKLDHKTGEGIAYLHDQERQGLQKFIGHVPWEHQPLLLTLSRQVGADLGAPDGVIVFDPSAFAKKGTKSVGVARPARQGRELSGRRLHGIRLAKRTYDCQYTSVPSQGMDQGLHPSQGGRRAQGGQVPHPPRPGVADARRARFTAAARLDRGG